jgi:hypothetical protein
MQEGGQVGWDPISINRVLPWQSRVVMVYLFVVLLIGLVKATRLIHFWLSNSRAPRVHGHEPFAGTLIAEHRVKSLRRLAFLSLLVSLLGVAWVTSQYCAVASMEKITGPAMIFGVLAEELTTLSMGLGVSIFLYAMAMLCERLLVRTS